MWGLKWNPLYFPSENFFSFVSLSSHWPRPPPYAYAPWPKFDSDFHSENGCWYFMGRSRRPVPLPACDFGPGRAQNSLGLMLGSKRNPLYGCGTSRHRHRFQVCYCDCNCININTPSYNSTILLLICYHITLNMR